MFVWLLSNSQTPRMFILLQRTAAATERSQFIVMLGLRHMLGNSRNVTV